MPKIFIALVFLLLFCSCEKDEQPPVITITSPSENQSFTNGQMVNIVATITDEDQLHEVALYVTNSNNGNEILHFHDHVDVTVYELKKSFTAQAGINYRIRVEGDDHSGNRGQKQITVRGQ